MTSGAIADVYKQMKTDREAALEERLRSSKEKAQETEQSSRKVVRNIDPFERQRRQ